MWVCPSSMNNGKSLEPKSPDVQAVYAEQDGSSHEVLVGFDD
jgi:hypothetical protein